MAAPATPASLLAGPTVQIVAPVDKAPAASATGAIQRGVGMAAVVACGASAAIAGRRRRQRTTGGASSVALCAGPKILEGTGGPMPNDFWDPAGLAKGKSDEQLLYWRAVELKHGRVSMLAVLGWIHVAAGWHPIGDAAARTRVSDNPLVNVTQLPIGGVFQVVFTIMCFEWLTTYVLKPPARRPWDVLGWSDVIADEDWPDWKEAQLRELNNGRLAMFGILGLIGEAAYTGDYFKWGAPPAGFYVPDNWATYVVPTRFLP